MTRVRALAPVLVAGALTVVAVLTVRHAGCERSLSSRRLADTRHEHAAEDRLVDLRGIDAAVLDRSLSGCCAELRGAERAECTLERTDGGAACGNDIDVFGHGVILQGVEYQSQGPAKHCCGRASFQLILPRVGGPAVLQRRPFPKGPARPAR